MTEFKNQARAITDAEKVHAFDSDRSVASQRRVCHAWAAAQASTSTA